VATVLSILKQKICFMARKYSGRTTKSKKQRKLYPIIVLSLIFNFNIYHIKDLKFSEIRTNRNNPRTKDGTILQKKIYKIICLLIFWSDSSFFFHLLSHSFKSNGNLHRDYVYLLFNSWVQSSLRLFIRILSKAYMEPLISSAKLNRCLLTRQIG